MFIVGASATFDISGLKVSKSTRGNQVGSCHVPQVHGAIGCLARMPLPTSLGQLRSAAPPDHDGDGPGGPGGIEGALSSISSRLRFLH